MKSQLDTMIALVSCLIRDAEIQCGLRKREVSKDIDRLNRCAKARGLGFFTLDLPSLDGVLLELLENDVVVPHGPLTGRRSKADGRPRFLHGLWSLVMDNECRVAEDACPTAIFFLRQIACFGKKLEVPCSLTRTNAQVKEYWKNEQVIQIAALDWSADFLGDATKVSSFSSQYASEATPPPLFRGGEDDRQPVYRRETEEIAKNLDVVSSILSSTIGVFDLYNVETEHSSLLRHGPGAVSDGNKHTYKYDFPHWPRKLESMFPYSWNGSPALCAGEYSEDEPPSRLIAVPKTAKGPRLIACEPIAHQWNQQLVRKWIEGRVGDTFLRHFIDFSRQDLSQDLVVKASMDRSLSTVDLSSASDRLSCAVVETFFRNNQNLLDCLHAVRTRTVFDGILTGERSFIRKFAAQGSSLTFPIQTIIFLGFAFAACGCRTIEDMVALKGKVRVFGDDIILPRDAYTNLVDILHAFKLKVNVEKSFSHGHFRESCGMDAYRGHNVTPIKPRKLEWATPSGYQAWVDTSNNLHNAGCWITADAMVRRLNRYKIPIVDHRLGSFGYSSFCGSDLSGQDVRYNSRLQRDEVILRMPYTKATKRPKDGMGPLLQYFVERPDPSLPWKSGVPYTRSSVMKTVRVPTWEYNPAVPLREEGRRLG